MAEKCHDKICFKESLLRGEEKLDIIGTSEFRYLFFHVYTGAFYSDKPVLTKEDVFDAGSSKVLELEYRYEIKRDDLMKSTKEMLKKNNEVDYGALASDFEKVFAVYETLKPGDRYKLDYFSKREDTCLSLNQIEKVCIKGKSFFRAFFGIWLSDYSVSPRFTQELIGKNK